MLAPVDDSPDVNSPITLLGAIGLTTAELRPGLRLVEIYTMQRMLKAFWIGDPAATDVVVLLPGGMGGFAGPAKGLYLELADRAVAARRGALIVDYRKPGDLDRSLIDTAALIDWAFREGAQRFALVGHSFGGAIAIQAATTLGPLCVGVVTLATQSAGCEVAELLNDVPLLLLHGDHDEILSADNSTMVQAMAGHGEMRILQGAGHGLELRPRRRAFAGERVARPALCWPSRKKY